ncbi:non-specific serine/threonine protein kinase [Plasmodiophora brassicae]|uniref:Protein kinase domain-containing protein n=1 Tax=Plasmodiophora brassicae TaxID=37360 RepID=A0A0G4J5V5_PLABS|nr:hypothetical protein PBRA_009211 [Plasmodiophora brassicae]SPR00258.1 unnamed protein product [Plasmodiophora brassicae]
MGQPNHLPSSGHQATTLLAPTRSKPLQTLPPSSAAAPKSDLSAYEPVKTLRKTLQGSVVLMRHRSTGVRYAVKIAQKRLVNAGRSLSGVRVCENIQQEVALLRDLSRTPCANIIQMADCIEDDDRYIVVMEYAARGELFDFVEERGMLTEPKARQIFAGVVHGLESMHNRSICHLDLSLENILLADDATPKICDLGLARRLPPASGAPFQGSISTRPGKLSYMAPEVYVGRDFHGTQADVWSLGIVLFIMLFGFPPFEIADSSDIRYDFMQRRGLRALLDEWKLGSHVSRDALDLLAAILRPAHSRITLAGIMRHPWMTRAA